MDREKRVLTGDERFQALTEINHTSKADDAPSKNYMLPYDLHEYIWRDLTSHCIIIKVVSKKLAG